MHVNWSPLGIGRIGCWQNPAYFRWGGHLHTLKNFVFLFFTNLTWTIIIERGIANNHICCVAAYFWYFGTSGSSDVVSAQNKWSDTRYWIDARHTKPHDLILGDVKVLCEIGVLDGHSNGHDKMETIENAHLWALVNISIEHSLFMVGSVELEFDVDGTAIAVSKCWRWPVWAEGP